MVKFAEKTPQSWWYAWMNGFEHFLVEKQRLLSTENERGLKESVIATYRRCNPMRLRSEHLVGKSRKQIVIKENSRG